MVVRQETAEDHDGVYRLVAEAFATAKHSDGNEQDLVVALRKSKAFLPELSLVAEIDGQLAGHILLSKAAVGKTEVLVLAPLSVKPCFQRQGVGTALVNRAHQIAKEMGYPYSFVLGSEHYYPRVGYQPAEYFGVTVPPGIPSANFMALKLQNYLPTLKGKLAYASEFGL